MSFGDRRHRHGEKLGEPYVRYIYNFLRNGEVSARRQRARAWIALLSTRFAAAVAAFGRRWPRRRCGAALAP
jgi:hypothetical protein